MDEYLSFRIIDHAKAEEGDWHFIKFSQNFNSNSKFFANITDIVEILLLFVKQDIRVPLNPNLITLVILFQKTWNNYSKEILFYFLFFYC